MAILRPFFSRFFTNCIIIFHKTEVQIFAFEPIKIYNCLAPQNYRLNLSFVKYFFANYLQGQPLGIDTK